MGSERATQLADDFASANAEVIAFASACSREQWTTVVQGEEWTVGVVLHHVAEGHAQGMKWLALMAAGTDVTDSAEDIDRHNIEHAERCQAMAVDVAQTVALLEENGARLEAMLRDLTEQQLEQTAPFGPAGGQALPTWQLAAVAARHPREHLAHARAAAGLG
jgi:hypothetical protein